MRPVAQPALLIKHLLWTSNAWPLELEMMREARDAWRQRLVEEDDVGLDEARLEQRRPKVGVVYHLVLARVGRAVAQHVRDDDLVRAGHRAHLYMYMSMYMSMSMYMYMYMYLHSTCTCTAHHRATSVVSAGTTSLFTPRVPFVEGFAGGASLVLSPVNIHEVLDHCLGVASASYGAHLSVRRQYDPSLPPVNGHRDLLIQAFINIINHMYKDFEKIVYFINKLRFFLYIKKIIML